MSDTTETKTAIEAFLAGETLWVKATGWEKYGLSEAHEAFVKAKTEAFTAFRAAVDAKFPGVPAGKTLEVFPGKGTTTGLKLADPRKARGAKAADDSADVLAVLLAADKATVKGPAPKRK